MFLGAVMGHGLPLQGRCLEGFDFLGLHQKVYLVSSMAEHPADNR